MRRSDFEAMGTTCSLFGDGDLAAGERWVRDVEARVTRFESDNELARLNGSHGRWVQVSDELEQMLRASLRAFEVSAGLVNIAVLPSMLAIGYTRPLARGAGAATLDTGPAPSLPVVLEVSRGLARLAPGAGIDLGGIAKGWMADRLCERLGDNSLVNLGGDLRAFGRGPDGNGWPVGIAGQTYLLNDAGVATSSTRHRRWGENLHHLIDPRTGLPAQSGLSDVSVVAPTATDAEMTAKAALIAGPDIAPAICASQAQAWWLMP